MIYEYRTKVKTGFDSVVVPADTVVATVTTDRPLANILPGMITTDYPLDNILAGIRTSQFTVTKIEPPKPVKPHAKPKPISAAQEPPAEETTTKEKVPAKGRFKKSKWA